MQMDNNEAVDEQSEVNAAATENVAANCDDGSSTNVQSDEISVTANELLNDKNMTESNGDDEPKAGNLEQKADSN